MRLAWRQPVLPRWNRSRVFRMCFCRLNPMPTRRFGCCQYGRRAGATSGAKPPTRPASYMRGCLCRLTVRPAQRNAAGVPRAAAAFGGMGRHGQMRQGPLPKGHAPAPVPQYQALWRGWWICDAIFSAPAATPRRIVADCAQKTACVAAHTSYPACLSRRTAPSWRAAPRHPPGCRLAPLRPTGRASAAAPRDPSLLGPVYGDARRHEL